MLTQYLQLALFAVLGGLCLWGWRVELARGKAWQVDTSGTLPPRVRRFRVVGEGESILLGDSEEESGDNLSASPTLVAHAFHLRDDDGNLEEVAAGTILEIRKIEGARRGQVDTITPGESVKTWFSFEVRAETPLFAPATGRRAGALPYRELMGRTLSRKRFVLAGTPEAVAGVFLPGCWLFVLFAFVASGAVASLLHAVTLAWVLLGLSLGLVGMGAMALPEKPPGPPEPS